MHDLRGPAEERSSSSLRAHVLHEMRKEAREVPDVPRTCDEGTEDLLRPPVSLKSARHEGFNTDLRHVSGSGNRSHDLFTLSTPSTSIFQSQLAQQTHEPLSIHPL